jgi:hypothetical protein
MQSTRTDPHLPNQASQVEKIQEFLYTLEKTQQVRPTTRSLP